MYYADRIIFLIMFKWLSEKKNNSTAEEEWSDQDVAPTGSAFVVNKQLSSVKKKKKKKK